MKKPFQNYRKSREIRQAVLNKLDEELMGACNDDRVSPEEVVKMMDARRKVELNGHEQGISRSDVLKVVANVAIVAVMVGFEMSHIMNQKGSRFIKAL
jgi:hypothetical protein